MKLLKRILRFFLWLVAILGIVTVCFMFFFKQIKASLIAQGVEKINEQLVSKVDVNPNIELSLFEDFPYATLIFHDVKIYEPGEKTNPLLLASAQKLSLGFDIVKVVLHKKYTLEKVYLYKAAIFPGIKANGEPNYTIFKPADSTIPTSPLDLNMKKIVLEEVSFNYFNKISKHNYDIDVIKTSANFRLHNNEYHITLDGDLNVQGIAIDQLTYFKNRSIHLDGSLTYLQNDELVKLDNTSIELNGSRYKIEGSIHTGDKKTLDLHFTSKSGEIATLLSLLPSKDAAWIKQYQNNGKVYFDATIKGKYGKAGNPAVRILFGFEQTDIHHPEGGQSIKNATLKGSFSNGDQHTSQTSSIAIEQFSGLLNGNPIKGSFKLTNLTDPFLTINAELAQNLEDIDQFIPLEGIDSLKGKINLTFDFEGQLKHLKRKEDVEKIKASGEAQIKEGELYISSIKKSMKNITADLIFNNTDISINNLSFTTAHSDIAVEGIIKNVLRKLLLGKGSIFIEGSMHSKKLAYEDFMLPPPNKEEKKSENATTSLVLSLDCRVDQMYLAGLHASELSGLLQYNDSLMTFTNGKMNICGGKVSGDARMEIKLPQRSRHIRLSNTFSGIAIDSLLFDFHDFEQTFISHKNLSGNLSGKSNVFCIFNPDGTVMHESILANIDLEISNGRLRDFAPMMSLSKFAEEAALKDVRFSKLTNQILIQNKVISIPNMRITSNVCDIDMSGTHSFDNVFSYRLKIPLKNLSKKKQTEAVEKGAMEDAGLFSRANIFVVIEGKGNNFEVKFDKSTVRKKIQADLQKEKEELKKAFRNDTPEIKNSQINQEEFFEFE